MELPILYRDDALIVTVKPVGVLSEDVPGGLLPLLREQLRIRELYCVHRLDRSVGGAIAVARTKAAAAAMTRAFTEGTVDKRYLAVVSGVPVPEEGRMEDLLYHDPIRNRTFPVDRMRKGVKKAVLEYRVLRVREADPELPVPALSLCEVRPLTGRSHQIRVQFASRKHPLAGDRRYGSAVTGCSAALFCRSLAFAHPVNGKPVNCSVLPPDALPWRLFGTAEELEKLL